MADTTKEKAKSINRQNAIKNTKQELGKLKDEFLETASAVRDRAEIVLSDTIDFAKGFIDTPDKLNVALLAVEKKANQPLNDLIMKNRKLAFRIRQALNAYAANDLEFKKNLDCATLIERIKDGDNSAIDALTTLMGKSYTERGAAFVFRGAARDRIYTEYEKAINALITQHPILNQQSMKYIIRQELYPPKI